MSHLWDHSKLRQLLHETICLILRLVLCNETFHSWHQSIWPLNLRCQESFRQSLLSRSKISDLQLFAAETPMRLNAPHRREVRTWGCSATLPMPASQCIIWARNHPHNVRKGCQVFPGSTYRLLRHIPKNPTLCYGIVQGSHKVNVSKRVPIMKGTCEKTWMLLFPYVMIWRSALSKMLKCRMNSIKNNPFSLKTTRSSPEKSS